jgi:hypothetical protein
MNPQLTTHGRLLEPDTLLRDYYPQALVAFCEPGAPRGRERAAGRRNDAGLAENISSTLRAEALRQPAPVEHALGVAAIGLIETITGRELMRRKMTVLGAAAAVVMAAGIAVPLLAVPPALAAGWPRR